MKMELLSKCSNEFQQGWLAYKQNKSIKDNPYTLEQVNKRFEWCEGFICSRDGINDILGDSDDT